MASKVCSIHKPRVEPLPTPAELHQNLPATKLHEEWILRTRREILEILEGRSQRFLIIVGPCSIHDTQAALEYATRLRALSAEISDSFLVIMRVYFEKPRTSLGWKGFLYDPELDGSHQIAQGLKLTRQLLLDLADLQMPTAAEFLDPLTVPYVGDLISWACIGARTASSQTHRQMASGLTMPISFKNNTDGNIDVAINGVLSAATPHSFISTNQEGKLVSVHTYGNPHGHITLRGGLNKPNYDPQSIYDALEKLTQAKLPPRLIVDCSHDNSARKLELQPYVFQSVLRQFHDGNRAIRGVILESNLFAGNQQIPSSKSELQYAVSLTDPCLDWDTTEWLLRWAHKLVNDQLEDKNSDKPHVESKSVYAQI